MEGKYGYCTNSDGIFSGEYDTREAAIQGAMDECSLVPGTKVDIGRYRRVRFNINVDDIIEVLNEHAVEEAGESAEDFLCYLPERQKDELEDLLNSALNVWLMKHEHDQVIYSAISIQTLDVEAEKK